MSKHLTVQDKILIHLSGYSRFAEEFECPEEMSQAGIAEAIGKSRAHTTLELNKLKDTEHIAEKPAHVKGAKVKKKVYYLTNIGIAYNTNLRRSLEGLQVKIALDDSISEMNGKQAVEKLKKSGISEVMAMEFVTRSEDVIIFDQLPKEVTTDTTSSSVLPPKPKYFFGRKTELANIEEFFNTDQTRAMAVIGMPGIGKTTLSAKVMESSISGYKGIYIQLYSFDSPLSVSQQLGRILKGLGKTELASYLENRDAPELREIGWHLQNILNNEKIALIFDDYDSTEGNLDSYFGMLFDIFKSFKSSRMLVLSASRPGFYSTKDLALDKTIEEMNLEGLDEGASNQLLRTIDEITEPEERFKIFSAVDGHPLALELALADSPFGNFEDYVFERVLSRHPRSMELMSLCSVLRRPFSPLNMRFFGFDEPMQHTMFIELNDGRVRLQQAIAGAILGKIGERGRQKANELAAEYCEEFGEEPIETIHHLVEAGLTDNAVRQVIEYRDYLLSSSNLNDTLTILDKMNSQDPEIMDVKAEALNLIGEWDAALTLSEQLVNSDMQNEREFNALIRIARIHSKLGDKALALETLDNAEKAGVGFEDKGRLSAFAHTKASILKDMGDFDNAIKYLGTSIEAASEVGDRKEFLRGLMELGVVHLITGNFNDAKEDLTRALEEAIELGSQVDEARVRLNLSILERRTGETSTAVEQLEKAICLGRDLEQPRIIGYGLVAAAECHNVEKRPESALEVSDEAIQIFEGLHAMDMVSAAYSNKATALAWLGKEKEALVNYKVSLELMDGIDAPHSLGLRFFEYGIGGKILGNNELATEMLTRAAEIFKQIGAKANEEEAKDELKHL